MMAAIFTADPPRQSEESLALLSAMQIGGVATTSAAAARHRAGAAGTGNRTSASRRTAFTCGMGCR